eukprot:CAMPEP_0178404820 /NCGR_PEP_ID=MMETSP0689_2-20121128/18085_1 /TAXON_ID=160604 /ORGANISM="Amphidinium massartii, Strain CS-259" /LENGTH=628 /DNA_ID=CAMNT_0020025825 /DNA_START=275 /DNA_END=2161 /DNA_ORIENTATION=+
MAGDERWTPLHVAATAGHATAASILLQRGASVNTSSSEGHTALAVAVARGWSDMVQLLLSATANPCTQDRKLTSPLHVAAVRGDPLLGQLLLQSKAALEQKDSSGFTALLRACAKEERWPLAEVLLEARAEVGISAYGQGLTPLLLVAAWEDEKASSRAACRLLESLGDPAAVDIFGTTALHIACRNGRPELVTTLCRKGAPAAAQDNDGHFALQMLCACCAKEPDNQSLVEVAMNAILQADKAASNRLDFSDANALHSLLLLAGTEKTQPLMALRALIAAEADPTCEDESGFTAVHYAAKASAGAIDQSEMVLALKESAKVQGNPSFWDSLDIQKQRKTSNAKYLARRGGHHRIPLHIRQAVLDGDASLSAVAALISTGRCTKIVALIGAGASTSAGIPDFRSPSGLWAQAATRELFSYDGFFQEPDAFWIKAHELFNDREPTQTHAMLACLAERGLLHRIYTQNIDGLEEAAGIPPEMIIPCHGTAQRVRCSARREHTSCSRSTLSIAESVKLGHGAPVCEECGALLRPDIVFFGEPLPEEFENKNGEDVRECDLLIVIGTALSVYPVAGLVNRVSNLTPRLLLNHEAVGPWKVSQCSPENYRDVFYKGDCDSGSQELLRLLRWQK